VGVLNGPLDQRRGCFLSLFLGEHWARTDRCASSTFLSTIQGLVLVVMLRFEMGLKIRRVGGIYPQLWGKQRVHDHECSTVPSASRFVTFLKYLNTNDFRPSAPVLPSASTSLGWPDGVCSVDGRLWGRLIAGSEPWRSSPSFTPLFSSIVQF
jgi:hypothetical protein